MTREDERNRTTRNDGDEATAKTRGAIDPAEIGAVRLNPLTAPGQFAAADAPDSTDENGDSNRPRHS